jgi:hypothetical protein
VTGDGIPDHGRCRDFFWISGMSLSGIVKGVQRVHFPLTKGNSGRRQHHGAVSNLLHSPSVSLMDKSFQGQGRPHQQKRIVNHGFVRWQGFARSSIRHRHVKGDRSMNA